MNTRSAKRQHLVTRPGLTTAIGLAKMVKSRAITRLKERGWMVTSTSLSSSTTAGAPVNLTTSRMFKTSR